MATMKATQSVSLNKVSKSLTLEIRINDVRRFRIRVWIATKLIQAASWFCPFNIRIV